MSWDTGLRGKQKEAAEHVGKHARLLAGPGTGKTHVMTRRICYLVEAHGVNPADILVLTFTRAAASELRTRVRDEVGENQLPTISTLHSFALRQLLRNSHRIVALPQPLRIADDWEERNIIQEDLKTLLNLGDIRDAGNLLNQMSADWQSLTAEQDDWEVRFANPAFLDAWRQHRDVFRYTLRNELVYQLKHGLEEVEDFDVEGSPKYLLVDEYQDLNRCDLAVVQQIAERGAELYAAGDDDQSIYGFRMAHPEGIRRFQQDYAESEELDLKICYRCDADILKLGLFVAAQDVNRLPKPISTDDNRDGGEVFIVRFTNGVDEASGIAQICDHLVCQHGLEFQDILVLLRSDRRGVFSGPIVSALERIGIPASVATPETNLLDTDTGRQVLALLRLINNREDQLAWRTLFQIRKENGLGPKALQTIYEAASGKGQSFIQAVRALTSCTGNPVPFGKRLKQECDSIFELLDGFPSTGGGDGLYVCEVIAGLTARVANNSEEEEAVKAHLYKAREEIGAEDIATFVQGLEASSKNIEQELAEGQVNILTMHKAKGLTAKAVIVAVAEDQTIPGRALGDDLGDERRLLYVSLTRAKHHLFVTYCNRRDGRQKHTGRYSGNPRRVLTRFLTNAYMSPKAGRQFLRTLGEHTE